MLQRQHDRPACLLRAVAEIDDTKCMQAVICQPALHHMFVHGGGVWAQLGGLTFLLGSAPSSLPAQQMNICGGDRSSQNGVLPVYIESDTSHPIASRGSRRGWLPMRAKGNCRASLYILRPRQTRSHPSHSSCNVSIAAIPEFSGCQKYRINMLSIHIATKLYK